jgi:hypothetical protein
MANYFRHFPKTPYLSERNGDLNLATNIIARVKFIDTIKNIVTSYFTYDIVNDDSPESLSYKFYGTSSKHWIILLLNDIIDPQFDWYMNYETFNKYVDEKYYSIAIENGFTSGLEFSQNSEKDFTLNKKYYIKEERYIEGLENSETVIQLTETDFESWTSFVSTRDVEIVKTLTNSEGGNYVLRIVPSKIFKNFYELEVENNEKKKSIKILNKEYVSRVEEELKNLLFIG